MPAYPEPSRHGFQGMFAALEQQIASINSWIRASGSAEAWKAAPAFEHAWENFEAGARKAEYMKDPMGFVHLRGVIKNGELAKSVFVLPAGYRPQNEESFVVWAEQGAAWIRVFTNGEVFVWNAMTGVLPKTFTFLDGVAFSVN